MRGNRVCYKNLGNGDPASRIVTIGRQAFRFDFDDCARSVAILSVPSLELFTATHRSLHCLLSYSKGWTVVGVVTRPLAAGLRQFDTCRRFILLSRLQSVMNTAARLIFSSSRFQHITPLLRQLHWLKAPERIAFKQSVLVYKCLHGSAPAYWRALSGGRCRGSSATPFQFIFIIDCHLHTTPYRRWPSFPGRRCTCLEQSARSCHFRTFRSSLPVSA